MCKSPTHKNYRDAIEGLRIQAHLAKLDIEKALAAPRPPQEPIDEIILNQHHLEEAAERLLFGKHELRDADVALQAHFTRGCSNLRTL